MYAALVIAAKDLRQRFRDRSALVLGFVAPIAVAALMSFAFSGVENFHADVALVDNDRGQVAAALRTALTGPELSDVLTIREADDEAAARRMIDAGDVGAAFVVPRGFSAAAVGAAIVQTRQLGIDNRAQAAPIRVRSLVLGEALCYLTFSVLQSVLIVAVGALLFGVSWGNPLAAATLIGSWALVGTGAGMLSGAAFKTPDQASAIGPVIGIAFGMLGGCMWPLAIVPDAVRTLGHITPHAWAVDAWITVLSRDGGVVDIATNLAVLAAFAVGMLGLASVLLQRRLTS